MEPDSTSVSAPVFKSWDRSAALAPRGFAVVGNPVDRVVEERDRIQQVASRAVVGIGDLGDGAGRPVPAVDDRDTREFGAQLVVGRRLFTDSEHYPPLIEFGDLGVLVGRRWERIHGADRLVGLDEQDVVIATGDDLATGSDGHRLAILAGVDATFRQRSIPVVGQLHLACRPADLLGDRLGGRTVRGLSGVGAPADPEGHGCQQESAAGCGR